MSERIVRVLLVEDNAADVELFHRHLSQARTKFEVESYSLVVQALDAVEQGDWDVIIADLSLPDSHGLETVTRLRSSSPDVPIIVLTGLASDETALRSLYEGVQDYLVKDDITAELLERAIRYAIQRQKNVQMRRLLRKVRASERQLEAKNRRLKQLCKTAHRFVDDVSHEFRTPLTVVREYTAIMQEKLVGELNDKQLQMLNVVADRVDDLNTMVDDMLDNSRMRAGLLATRRRTCRIADIIEHVRPSLENKSNLRDVRLEFDLPDSIPAVYCDDEKVGRVIVNLTINGIKFADEPGRVLLWVKDRPEQRDVEIGISDNGPGISPECRKKIFERFNQVDGASRGSTKGFGLGLSIAKDLVDLNFGEINVESEMGQGSTFSITLPVFDPAEIVRRYMRRIENLRNGHSVVSVLELSIDGSPNSDLLRETGEFLHDLLRQNDLLLEVGVGRWIAVMPVGEDDAAQFKARVARELEAMNRNRPMEPLPEIGVTLAASSEVKEKNERIADIVSQLIPTDEVQHVENNLAL